MAAKPGGGRAIGVKQARDERHLAGELRKERMALLRSMKLPVAVRESTSDVKLKDQAELNTQLAQLLSRGSPLVEALEVTGASVSNAMKPRALRMRDLVAGGASFADACDQVGGFDRVTVALYRAAERTGDLAGAAKQLAIAARRQLQVQGKAATLMIYPAILLTITTLAAAFLLTQILPKIGEALAAAGAQLPLFTRILLAIGTFLRDNLLPVLIGVTLVVGATIIFRKIVGAFIFGFMRKAPAIRHVVLAQESARFFSVMAALTRCGVPLADALGIASGAITHPEMREQLEKLRTRLIEGGVLRNLIDDVVALPITTRRLMIAAERAGDLQSAFDTLATDAMEEVETRSQRLIAMMEPAVIVFLFLVVGSVILGVMIPLLNLSSSVGMGG
ncbi:MAG: type II secretion system F family protein [Phycisphaerae bacterium]|nr:type II secretion system F family protein [Phycisphaerae bacterium]MBN8596908.1 type II secretion system F family protein [Planctomycetota bacterium]